MWAIESGVRLFGQLPKRVRERSRHNFRDDKSISYIKLRAKKPFIEAKITLVEVRKKLEAIDFVFKKHHCFFRTNDGGMLSEMGTLLPDDLLIAKNKTIPVSVLAHILVHLTIFVALLLVRGGSGQKAQPVIGRKRKFYKDEAIVIPIKEDEAEVWLILGVQLIKERLDTAHWVANLYTQRMITDPPGRRDQRKLLEKMINEYAMFALTANRHIHSSFTPRPIIS